MIDLIGLYAAVVLVTDGPVLAQTEHGAHPPGHQMQMPAPKKAKAAPAPKAQRRILRQKQSTHAPEAGPTTGNRPAKIKPTIR